MAQLVDQDNFRLAVQHRQAGRLAEAEAVCRQMLDRQPLDARAITLLGAIALVRGQTGTAIDFFRRAISVDPSYVRAHFHLGSALTKLRKFDEALMAYRQTVALNPRFARGYFGMGNVLQENGQPNDAISAYKSAIEINPEYASACANLAIALISINQYSEAISAVEKAIELDPNLVEAHCTHAAALGKNGRYRDAIKAYERAIALRPGLTGAMIDMGYMQSYIGQYNAAIEAADSAIAVDPGIPAAHMLKGISLREKTEPEQAISCFRAAIAINPHLANAHSELGMALMAVGLIDQAVEETRLAVKLNPNNAAIHSSHVMMLHYHPDYDSQTLARNCREWNAQHALPLQALAPAISKPLVKDRPLRVGYVSPDFNRHSVGRSLLPLFRHHDQARFQVYCYAHVSCPDLITEQLKKFAYCWRDTVGVSDADVAELIREDKIDILVDLSLHSSANRLLVFARKPAPLQITWLGYPGSTGLNTIDFRLSDPFLDPPGFDASVYSEKTFRLPETYWCYEAKPVAPTVGPLPARQTGKITFGCLNNFGKVSRPALLTWGKILQLVPGSTLHMHAHPGSARALVEKVLGDIGIGSDRLNFSARVRPGEYFELYNKIDIGLDPFPFAGGITTCDALWMGVPVVTLLGKTVTGRGGNSLLCNIQMQELIAKDLQQYVEIVVGLASDLDRLEQIRKGLREQMAYSPIMRSERFARHMEAAYLQMWESIK